MAILKSQFRKFATKLLSLRTASRARALLGAHANDPARLHALMARATGSGDDALARAVCEMLLTADPPQPDALEHLANLYLQQGKPLEALPLFVTHSLRMGQSPRPDLYRNAYMDPDQSAQGRPYVHTLHDVILETTQCAVFDGEKIYIRETSGTNLLNSPHIRVHSTPGQEFFVIACRDPEHVVASPCILLGTDGAYNYSHWLTRNLLKFAVLEWSGVSTDLPLLVNENLCSYQIEALDMLGIPQKRLLQVARGLVLRCQEIHIPVNMRFHPEMRSAMEWLRRRLLQPLEPISREGRLIYISRRDSRRHVLRNESELTEALNRLGFEAVVLTGMSFADQIRTFAGAKVIVGAHGAGLTNIMFAPTHAVIIEITNTNLRHMGDFRTIASELGMGYAEIVSSAFAHDQTTAFPPDFDYYVDVDSVIDRVQSLIDSGAAAP